MSIKYSTRQVGDVTILDISGRITLGEGATAFRDGVRELLAEGRKNLLLNLSDLSYMDSSGNGEIVSAFTTVTNFGGRLKLVNLTKRIHDILQITKLYTVYEVFDDEAVAVRSFGPDVAYSRCRCPVCGSWSAPSEPGSDGRLAQKCVLCGAEFTVELLEDAQRALVVAIKMRTYWDGNADVRCGVPFSVEIHGRLTLFSVNAVQRVWRVIPKPRRVLFDLRHVTEIEPGGMEAFVKLLTDGDSRVAVSTEGLAGSLSEFLPPSPLFHPSHKAALEALGDVSDTPQLFVSIGKL